MDIHRYFFYENLITLIDIKRANNIDCVNTILNKNSGGDSKLNINYEIYINDFDLLYSDNARFMGEN